MAMLVTAESVTASEVHVPADVPTIQEAIDLAKPGDVVLVAPGVYYEHIDFKGKAVSLQSEAGPEATVIDGGHEPGSVLRCVTDEGPDTVIVGFRITGGTGDSGLFGADATVGGGMLNMGSSPTVEACHFVDNTATYNGGGMYNSRKSKVRVRGCRFENNRAEKGGGVFSTSSSPEITDCLFLMNAARYGGGGIYNTYGGAATIIDCQFTRNIATYNGGAIYDYDSRPLVLRCTFTRNAATYKGGAIYHGYRSGATVTDCNFVTPNDDVAGIGGLVQSPQRVRGACCLGTACVLVEEDPCLAAGGVWLGSETICEDDGVDCPQPLLGDLNDDGVVNEVDMAILMSVFGRQVNEAEEQADTEDEAAGAGDGAARSSGGAPGSAASSGG